MTYSNPIAQPIRAYDKFRRFDCQRCGHAYLNEQPRPQCPACGAGIDYQTRTDQPAQTNEHEDDNDAT